MRTIPMSFNDGWEQNRLTGILELPREYRSVVDGDLRTNTTSVIATIPDHTLFRDD